MKLSVALMISCLPFFSGLAQGDKMDIYLIPGQGSDHRLFSKLELGDQFNIIHVDHCIPDEGMSMSEYAQELLYQIDTTHQYILIGVSLGGMLSVEINELHHPYQTIIISSAKNRNELPFRYRFQKQIPIYKLVSGKMSKKGALLLQPIVEPDRNNQKDTFVNMLESKDPDFLKRTITMILEWTREETPENIVHIHGDKDRTIPIRNVDFDFSIEYGSHMMVLTRGEEISQLILEIIEED